MGSWAIIGPPSDMLNCCRRVLALSIVFDSLQRYSPQSLCRGRSNPSKINLCCLRLDSCQCLINSGFTAPPGKSNELEVPDLVCKAQDFTNYSHFSWLRRAFDAVCKSVPAALWAEAGMGSKIHPFRAVCWGKLWFKMARMLIGHSNRAT